MNMLATPSTSHPILNEIPPCITVTLDELARALDQMGSRDPVSATRLYHTLLQLHPIHPPTTLWGKSDHIHANTCYTMNSSASPYGPESVTPTEGAPTPLQSKSNSRFLWQATIYNELFSCYGPPKRPGFFYPV
jgi:hypothetical protein